MPEPNRLATRIGSAQAVFEHTLCLELTRPEPFDNYSNDHLMVQSVWDARQSYRFCGGPDGIAWPRVAGGGIEIHPG
jgi:hypothetical protein